MKAVLTFKRLLIREEEIEVPDIATLTEYARKRAKTMKNKEFDSVKNNEVTALLDGILPFTLDMD